jgi:hypothetical protein
MSILNAQDSIMAYQGSDLPLNERIQLVSLRSVNHNDGAWQVSIVIKLADGNTFSTAFAVR